jgi:hypothetical protein
MASTTSRGGPSRRTRFAVLATLSSASLLTLGAGGVAAARLPDVTVKVVDATLRVDGSGGDDSILLRIRPNEPTILQVLASGRQVGNIDRSRFGSILVQANAGDDAVVVDESFGAFTAATPTTIDGGAGDDTLIGDTGPVRLVGGAGNDQLLGGDAVDELFGGDGNDSIDGNRGADVAFGNAGDDTFVWDPGDGSDAFDGQDGTDSLVFNGAAGNEKFELAASGSRLRFTRDAGNITMDIGTTENVVANAEGGIDRVTIDDLSATDVVSVKVDLAGTPGTGAGDGAADQVIVRGTARADAIDIDASASTATVSGLHARVAISGAEAARDRLDIDTGDGVDPIDTTGVAAGSIPVFVDGQPL